MSIASELIKLGTTKTAIADAIASHGENVGNIPFDQYPAKISAIQSGDSCALANLSGLEALFSGSDSIVNGRLIAGKQPNYARVDPEQMGVFEVGDGSTVYRLLPNPPVSGFIEVEFIHSAATVLLGCYGSTRCWINIYEGKISGALGSQWHTIIKGVTPLIIGNRYKCKLEWTGATVNLYLNDVLEYSGGQAGNVPPLQLALYGLNTSSAANSFSSVNIISVNINDEHFYSAANMYYDQIGSSNAVAYGGTPVVTANALGDHSMNERGYSLDGSTIIPANQAGTLAADGSSLQYADRNAHGLEIVSGTSFADYIVRYQDDGRLDQYLAGSGLEDGASIAWSSIVSTPTVRKTPDNKLVISNEELTVDNMLDQLCGN